MKFIFSSAVFQLELS